MTLIINEIIEEVVKKKARLMYEPTLVIYIDDNCFREALREIKGVVSEDVLQFFKDGEYLMGYPVFRLVTNNDAHPPYRIIEV